MMRLTDLANELGFDLVDLKKRDYEVREVHDSFVFSEIKVTSLAYQFDGVITIPTLKTHSAAKISVAMKSLMGFLHDSFKRRFHSYDLSQAIVDLNKIINLDYVMLDGIYGKISA